jgi:peptide/nickel transport system substrate-binding protein
MISRREFLRGTAATLPVLLAAACAPAATPTEAPAEPTEPPAEEPTEAPAEPEAEAGGVLRLVYTSDPRWFDPARQMGNFDWGALYDSLLRYTPNMEVYPHLAESFDIIEDGKAISLKLREGVKFHSGREFTSDDVEWMISHIQEAESGALFRTFALSITEMEKPDKYSIILRTEQPDAGMIDLLGNLYICDRDYIDSIEREGHGTGPFEFVEFIPGDHITYKRNENYWGPKPYLDQIEISIVGDEQAVVANLEAGAADLVGVPLEEYARLKDDPAYKTVKMVGGAGIRNVWLNMKREPFGDKLVRHAINHSIDRERYVRTILMGESTPLWQPMADYHWAHFPELEGKFPFDLDTAQSLLEDAGLGDGFETTINTTSDAGALGLAEIMQSDLAKIGVVAEINAMDGPTWAQASDKSQFDINMHNYGRNNADPTLLFKGTVAWRPEQNPSGIEDPEYLRLINEQAAVLDREQRKPLVKNLIEYLQDMSFVIPVCGNVSTYVYDTRIEGFEVIPVGTVVYTEKIRFND